MTPMQDENGFRRYTIGLANGIGCHVSHIESHQSSAGIPDLNIFPPSKGTPRPDVWLELKVIKDGQIRLRPTQKKWHRERNEAGGRSWVAVLDRQTGDILVVPGHVAATLDNRAAAWRAVATVWNVLRCDDWLYWLIVENEYGNAPIGVINRAVALEKDNARKRATRAANATAIPAGAGVQGGRSIDQQAPDRDRSPKGEGSAEAALPAGGEDVGGHHWLTDKP